VIEPFYPKTVNRRPPMLLSTMLRIYFMQQWFGYSEPAMEEDLHDFPLLRRFAGLDAFEDAMPDESTVLRIRHLLEQNELAVAIFAKVNAVLSEKGPSMKRGSVVDAALIATPSSTKNQDKQCDPEMSQIKKGNKWHFGTTSRRQRTPMVRSREAGCGHERNLAAQVTHIDVDAESGPTQPVECTAAKAAHSVMLEDCLHGDKQIVFADRGNNQNNRTIEHLASEDGLAILAPTKKPKGGELTELQKTFNRILWAIRAVVEHPFRVIKQQIGFIEVRYRGLKKNIGQIVTLFALSNLWMARHSLIPITGEVCPLCGK
jgi:transposase, IS5 family